MTDHADGSDQPARVGPLRALAFGLFLRRRANLARGSEAPSVVRRTTASNALERRAWELASLGRDDPNAIQELASIAHNSRRSLELAAAQVRFSYRWARTRQADLANRLLLAAAYNKPIAVVPREDEVWFDQLESLEVGLDQLERGEDADGFARLASLEPQLAQLETDFLSGARGMAEIGPGMTERRLQYLAPFMERLRHLLGEEAEVDVPLLRTDIAFETARLHLLVASRWPIGADGALL